MALHESHIRHIRSLWNKEVNDEKELRKLLLYAKYAPAYEDKDALDKAYGESPEKFKLFTKRGLTYYAFGQPRKKGNRPGPSPKNPAYKSFEIPKKSGGVRIIHAPVPGLMRVQKGINTIFQALFRPHFAANGFTPGKSIVTNAQKHIGKTWVLNMDLEDFFPSIEFRRVKAVLELPPFNLSGEREELGFMIANLCCLDGRLPQGAPTSPILSNIICQRLDRTLHRMARKHQATYTRYADDLTFSRYEGEFEDSFIEEVREIVESERFLLNEKKIRQQYRGGRQEVTGLVVNEKVNVKREYIRATRTMLHNWERSYEQAVRTFWENTPDSEVDFVTSLNGRIQFIGMVRGWEDPVYTRFKERFERLRQSRTLEDLAVPIDQILTLWEGEGVEKVWRSLVGEAEDKKIDQTGLILVYEEIRKRINELKDYRYRVAKDELRLRFFRLLSGLSEKIVNQSGKLESLIDESTHGTKAAAMLEKFRSFIERDLRLIEKAPVSGDDDSLGELFGMVISLQKTCTYRLVGKLDGKEFNPQYIALRSVKEEKEKPKTLGNHYTSDDSEKGWIWWQEGGGVPKVSNAYAASVLKGEGKEFIRDIIRNGVNATKEQVYVVNPVVLSSHLGGLKEWEGNAPNLPDPFENLEEKKKDVRLIEKPQTFDPDTYNLPESVRVGKAIDLKKGNPKSGAEFLTKAFGQSEYLKYMTHDNDEESKYTYQELIDGAEKEFRALTAGQDIPGNIWGLVNRYCFNSDPDQPKNDWWTSSDGTKVYFGWSKPEVREWIEERGRDWSNPEESIHGFDDFVSKFKKTIEVRDKDLEILFRGLIDSSSRGRRQIQIEFDSNWTHLEFYTQVEKLKYGLKRIIISSRSHNQVSKLIISTRKVRGKDGLEYNEIKLYEPFAEGQRISKNADGCEIGFKKGDLLGARKNLVGLCEWEIVTRFHDGPYSFPLLALDHNRVGIPEPVKDSEIQGFCHILKFY